MYHTCIIHTTLSSLPLTVSVIHLIAETLHWYMKWIWPTKWFKIKCWHCTLVCRWERIVYWKVYSATSKLHLYCRLQCDLIPETCTFTTLNTFTRSHLFPINCVKTTSSFNTLIPPRIYIPEVFAVLATPL